MAGRPAGPSSSVVASDRALDGSFRLVLILAAICVALVAVSVLSGAAGHGAAGRAGIATSASPTTSVAPSVDVAEYLEPGASAAPALALVDPDARPFSLASLRGDFVFVFFGYTHCPDVCPATIGTVGQAIDSLGIGARAVFVSVDPERDTTTWLKGYSQYLPTGFTAVTGSAAEVRQAADAWGVKYSRVETAVAGDYSMSHTADVFLVDPLGDRVARFPFGTSSAAMTATVGDLSRLAVDPSPGPPSAPAASVGSPAPIGSAAPAPASASVPAVAGLRVDVVSSSIWAGGPSPVILALYGPAGRVNDTSLRPVVQLGRIDGSVLGPPIEALPVKPPGQTVVSYVAVLDLPTSGWWRIDVSATPGLVALTGSTDIVALDAGTSAPIGSAAPTIRTPTMADVAGDVRQLTTDPIPDLRLYRTSTADELAGHRPFVLVLDSTKFRVTTACGKALIMARFLQDRWPDVTFIHHEPFRYSVVTDTPVLEGTLSEPRLTAVADAWGIGGDPWGPLSMPWVFVVDGDGLIRAKYQGVMGSDDIDVIVALIAQGG